MPRYKLTIEYDGTPFGGWQRQENAPTVQEALEQAVLSMTGESVTVIGAGRTDAGVHALGQVAHVDLARAFPGERLRGGLNFHLRPAPIAVLGAESVDDNFHARFSAIRRHYLYRIVNRRSPLVLDRDRAWHVARPLDVAAMHAAARHLIGKHDFTTFRSAHCQSASPVKTLDLLSVSRSGEIVEIRTNARSFLHNQVRSMVGSLKLVGEGSWTPADMAAALQARDRAACGMVAPPWGLYLTQVDYPPAPVSE
ncbi:tRNA pseudouridine(38-40) synthase TruA [Rhodoligotrophos defluvii]|uniref:tRNA pseudouridine(38-40) synthase TruA n=1 Tax=Rhodoligotrophos defluvii TaxID=2561934 RepID=UPI0010C9992B|nr:tRNA pseudouridine(38-40) synthase TruA [Rhodoligotrophos defluvii]